MGRAVTPDSRGRSALVVLVCLFAAAFAPALAEGKGKGKSKRTVTTKVELPLAGKINYAQVVVKTKKRKKGSRSGARSLVSAKGKKAPVKFKIKNRKKLGDNVLVYARVGTLKKKSGKGKRKNRLLVDYVVINQRATARAAGNQAGQLQPLGLITMQAVAVPPIIRAEGIAERVGDIVLTCIDVPPCEDVSRNANVFLTNNTFPKNLFGSTPSGYGPWRTLDIIDGLLGGTAAPASFFSDFAADPPVTRFCASSLTSDGTQVTSNVVCNHPIFRIDYSLPAGRTLASSTPPANQTCSAGTTTLSCTGTVAAGAPIVWRFTTTPTATTGFLITFSTNGTLGPFLSTPLP